MLLCHQLIWKMYFTLNQWLHIIKSMQSFFANEHFKFTCMSNGHGPVMRIFTKITKVPFSVLRMQSHTSVVYVDDSYLQWDLWKLFEECKWYNNYVAIIRFYYSSWKISIKTHTKFNIFRFYQTLKIWLWNWQKRKNKKFMTVQNFLKNQNPQCDF